MVLVTSLSAIGNDQYLTKVESLNNWTKLSDECDCRYRIYEVDASPFSFGDPINGFVDYYLTGAIPNGGCTGTMDNCTAFPCFEMSAYGSGNSGGCQCCDPNCTDFIYDDGSSSTYPTSVYNFRCFVPKFSTFDIMWQPLWINSGCAGQDLVAHGSKIIFEVYCGDGGVGGHGSPPPFDPDDCNVFYRSGLITLEKNAANPAPSVEIELEECGCKIKVIE